MPLRADYQSFNGGEIGPELAARLDVAKYHTALRKARNVLLLVGGGVTSRPGLEFIGQARDITHPVRVAPFQFSSAQSYVLEFGNGSMRVIKDGAYVLESGKALSGLAGVDPMTVQATAHGYSRGDDVYFVGNVGLEDADGISLLNGKVLKVGAVTANTFVVCDELSQPLDASGASAYITAGSVLRLYRIDCPFAPGDLADVRFVQSADVLYLVHNNYQPLKLTRTGDASWTFTAVAFGPSISAPTGLSVTPHVVTTGAPRTYSYLVTSIDELTGQESYNSNSSAANNDLSQDGNTNTIAWTAVAKASRYNVYEEVNGIYGYIGGTTDLSFVDRNITPDLGDTPPKAALPFQGGGNYPAAIAFHEQRLTFGGTLNKVNGVWMSQTGNYENLSVSVPPKADDSVSFGLVAQQVNEVRAFVSTQVGLIAFTSDAIFSVTGGGVTDYITPSSIVVRPALHRGAGKAQPVAIDEVVMFSQAKGAFVRTINYQYAYGGYTGNNISVFAPHFFKGFSIVEFAWAEYPNATVYALRDDGVLLALLWLPEQDVWGWTMIETAGAVESICTVTEAGEDRLYAVVNRLVGGVQRRYVERLASTLWTDAADAFYVDAGVGYSGSPESVFGGLDHLEGETVSILADGAVRAAQAVSGGKVKLDAPASKVAVGLPYRQYIHTLDPVLAAAAVVGKTLKTGATVLRVMNTRGVLVGPDEDGNEMFVAKGRSSEVYGSPPDLFTGDIPLTIAPHWNRSAGIAVVQTDPLPMTILGIFPDIDVGGS